MDKPISMSVKDYLMRVFSVRNNIPLKTIEAVVDFQFEEANKALKTNHSIEISGFGKFLFNHKKAEKIYNRQLEKIKTITSLLNNDMDDEERNKVNERLNIAYQYINLLKPKLHGLKTDTTDLGRVEEQDSTSTGDERTDTESIPGEKVNM